MTITLTLVMIVGIVAAIAGFCRKKEEWRLFGTATLALNIAAWWWATSLTEWAFNPPPGIDY